MLHRNVDRSPVLPTAMLAGLALCAVIASTPRPMVGSKHELTKGHVSQIAYRWYSYWVAQTDAECPGDLSELARIAGAPREDILDAWGAPFRFACKPAWFGVWSLGPDGRDGTGDEIKSWAWMTQRNACPSVLLSIARSINSERDNMDTSSNDSRVVCEHDPALDVWFLQDAIVP